MNKPGLLAAETRQMIFIDRQPQMPFGAQLINRHRNGPGGRTASTVLVTARR